MISAHPQKQPLLNNVLEFTERFKRAKPALEVQGIGAGILVQSLINHSERGRSPSDATFQRIVGYKGDEALACFCPLDTDFVQYARDITRIMAKADPAFLLYDDDIRLDHNPVGWGCFCPLHLKELGKKTGAEISREELLEILKSTDDKGIAMRKAWHETRQESLISLAYSIREVVDSVNPDTRCGICNAAANFSVVKKFAIAVAGKTRPLLRVGSGFYTQPGFKTLPKSIGSVACQVAYHKEDCDIDVLSECDTCPHTRYSLSATGLHAQLTGSLLVGANMAKMWVPNCLDWQYQETKGYRDVLGKNKPFFDAVEDISGNIEWAGPISPWINFEKHGYFERPWTDTSRTCLSSSAWGWPLLGRMGVPIRVSGQGEVRMFSGDSFAGYGREELESFFSQGLLLDGAAAHILSDMGFEELMGVHVDTSRPFVADFEQFSENAAYHGEYNGIRQYLVRGDLSETRTLTPCSDDVEIISWFMQWPHFQSMDQTRVAPAITVFENKLGGRVAVYSHDFSGKKAFASMMNTSFLDDRRKEQLTRVLAFLGNAPLPAITRNTADALAMYGKYTKEENTDIMTVLNLSSDPIDDLQVTLADGAPRKIEKLLEDGTWQALDFCERDNDIVIKTKVFQMQHLVVKICDPGHGCQ